MNTITVLLLFNPVSTAFDLPAGLLNSVCYIESSYKADAIHHDDGNGDSLGLCQIKIQTAKLMGFKGTIKQLMNPTINAYFAGKYLSHQLKRYNGNIAKALVAYNMGSAKNFTRSRYSDKVIKQWESMHVK